MVGHRFMLSIFQDALRFHLTSVVVFPFHDGTATFSCCAG